MGFLSGVVSLCYVLSMPSSFVHILILMSIGKRSRWRTTRSLDMGGCLGSGQLD